MQTVSRPTGVSRLVVPKKGQLLIPRRVLLYLYSCRFKLHKEHVDNNNPLAPCKLHHDPNHAREMLLLATSNEDQHRWVTRLSKRIQKSGYKANSTNNVGTLGGSGNTSTMGSTGGGSNSGSSTGGTSSGIGSNGNNLPTSNSNNSMDSAKVSPR